MPTQGEATEPDLVELVEELLAKATLPVKKHLRFGVGGILREPDGLLKPVVEVFNDEDFELYAAAPDLLRRLVEEVKRLRAHVTDLSHDMEASNQHCEEHHEVRTGY